MFDSVTVSMGDDTKGVFMVIFLVSADVKSWTIERSKTQTGSLMFQITCPVQCFNWDYSDYDPGLSNVHHDTPAKFLLWCYIKLVKLRLSALVKKY